MESRKVQKTGTSTMTVSLPRDWVTSNNLRPGDTVNIETLSDGSLTIDVKVRNRRDDARSVVTVERGEPDEHVIRKLIGAYLAGFNLIEARSRERMDLATKHAIKDFTRMVIGPEIIEETANSVVMHDLSDPVELPQKKCIRRMHLIVESMHGDAMTAYVSGDAELARDVIDRDQDVDRLYWMAMKQFVLIQKDRSLSERIGVDVYESFSLNTVGRILERVGDHAVRISRQAVDLADEPKTDVVLTDMRELSVRSVEVLSQAIGAFFHHDIAAANEVIDRAHDLAREGENLVPLLLGSGGKGTMSRTAVMDSLNRTFMYSSDIAEVAVNDAMRLQGGS
ncbi:MAG: phosphate uptake regulator PhoU [Methanomassiliicoccus sp.]|nr:phosphate uptake regulator PhoU [Methanomassiliicoccus sp.]